MTSARPQKITLDVLAERLDHLIGHVAALETKVENRNERAAAEAAIRAAADRDFELFKTEIKKDVEICFRQRREDRALYTRWGVALSLIVLGIASSLGIYWKVIGIIKF